MKYLTILLLFLIWYPFQVSGQEMPGAVMKLKSVTLNEIFRLFRQERQVDLFIDPDVPQTKTVSVDIDRLPVDDIYNLTLKMNGLVESRLKSGVRVIHPEAKKRLYQGENEFILLEVDNIFFDMNGFKNLLSTLCPEAKILDSPYLDGQKLLVGNGKDFDSAKQLYQRVKRSPIQIRLIRLAEGDKAGLLTSLKKLAPSIEPIEIPNSSSVFLLGSQAQLDQVEFLLEKVVTEQKESRPERVEIFLENLDYSRASKMVTGFSPDIKVIEGSEDYSIILVGRNLRDAKEYLEKQDGSAQGRAHIIPLSYLKVEEVMPIIQKFDKTAVMHPEKTSNSLIIKARNSSMVFLKSIIEKIDRGDTQVLIELHLIEMEVQKLRHLGVRFSQDTFSVAEIDKFIKSKNYPVFLNLINNDKTAKILAKPQLKLLEGKSAKIHIGDRIPIEVSTTSQTDSGSVLKFNNRIEFIDAGVLLEISEMKVHNESEITMQIKSEVSSVVSFTSQGLPQIRTRESLTHVRALDGETLIMAGLLNKEDRRVVSRTPLLEKMPVLGAFFQDADKRKTDTEIIMLLTPHIVRDRRLNPNEGWESDEKKPTPPVPVRITVEEPPTEILFPPREPRIQLRKRISAS